MQGRKPDSDTAKILRGTFRSDRSNAEAPIPERGMPALPGNLNGRVAEIFIEVSERVDKLLLASPSYVDMLVLIAQTKADIEEFDKLIDEHGMLTKNPKTGLLKKNPAVEMKHQAMRELKALLGEFGLSPREIGRVRKVGGGNDGQLSMFSEFAHGA